MTKKIISLCILCILATSTGLHAILDWNSAGTDGDWNTPASWDGGVVPTASDAARIAQATNVTVSATADASGLITGFDSTLTVDSGGDLTIANDMHVGNAGSVASGNKNGTVQLNSGGQIEVENDVLVGSWEPAIAGVSPPDAILEITGGTLKVQRYLQVALRGNGTLNLSGGTLSFVGNQWQQLVIGSYAGDGVINMTGGNLVTNGIRMDADATGIARINLDGGILEVNDAWAGSAANNYNDGVITFSANSAIVLGDGVFQMKENKLVAIDAWVTSGYITHGTAPLTNNYPEVTPDQSWLSADGNVTIHANFGGARTGYTTVWAISTDSDGDGVINIEDVHPGFNDAYLTAYLTTNNYAVDDGGPSLADHNAILDQLNNAKAARAGSSVIDVTEAVIEGVTTQVADITLRVEQTSDVSDWSSATTSDHTIQLSAPAGASFYRFTIPD